MKRLSRIAHSPCNVIASPVRAKQSLTRIVAITIPLLLLSACGDDITEINANVGAVATNDDLPECTESIAGQTAFIKETHEFLGCDGKEWQSLSANAVSVGDNVCMSKSLSDDSGFEIFCNGLSIGKIKNGQKGDAGEKGDAGTGCKIQESTALTATIACGSETFTMDLTGYVDVPVECDSSDSTCAVPLDNVDLSGVSQKGPFVSGTDVTAYELENGKSLKQTGKTFGGKIENQDGSFNIRTVKLKSSYAYLVADGFYRNEVTGENSAATIKLRALTNLDGRSTANINLVTHLEYDRVQRLVTKDNKSVIEAKRAAEKSLFAAFNIDNTGFKGFAEDYNILKEGDGNAALLAVSAMLQGDRTEAQLTALLASLSVDLGDNGQWDNKKERTQVADWAMKADVEGRLAKIRANVEGWKLSDSKAPAFEKHVTNFWTKELDVPACTKDGAGRLFAIKNENSSFYAKNDSVYTAGDSSLVRLICAASGDSYAWRLASDIEKDTAALAKNLPADTAIAGKINTDFVYVKEGKWRRGTELDMTLKFSCVANRKSATDTMTVDHETKWFICSEELVYVDGERIPTAWRAASTAEADTAGFGIPQTEKDSVKMGNINKSLVYVFEDVDGDGDGEWRFGTTLDYGLGPCTKDKLGTVKNLGNEPEDQKDPNKWYICVDNEYVLVEDFQVPTTWRKASDLEMDTYEWPVAEEGAIRNGSVNDNLTYVFENGMWRHGTRMDNVLGLSCILNIRDTVVQENQFTWYKCFADTADDLTVSSSWRKVVENELDMSYWNCFKDTLGKLLTGPYSGKIKVWDADTLRDANEMEVAWNLGCVRPFLDGSYVLPDQKSYYKCTSDGWVFDKEKNSGTVKDGAGKDYKTVVIGNQTWMAENMNLAIGGSSCYDGAQANCNNYGRLYTRGAALSVCPEGWRLPSKEDWEELKNVVDIGSDSIPGEKLRTTSGWNNNGNGTDYYGFSVLAGGHGSVASSAHYLEMGLSIFFWSGSIHEGNRYFAADVRYNSSIQLTSTYCGGCETLAYVRCVKNND